MPLLKYNLYDLTILILIRLDSISRLENILAISDYLQKHLKTNIVICEVSNISNCILKKLLHPSIQYHFIEDKDPILYKTKYFNILLKKVTTKFVSIWDADVICDPKSLMECIEMLRTDKVDIAWPYNGECLDTSYILRDFFLKSKNIKFLNSHQEKMYKFHNKSLVGGAIIMNLQKFINAGGENEKYYGWGDDDFDRYERFKNLNYNLYRTKNVLFHLSHMRLKNSTFSSIVRQDISKAELTKNKNISLL